MRAGISTKMGVFGLLALGMVACEQGDFSGNLGFKGRYTAARDALESGNYVRAARHYQQLIPQAGPFEARLRLEYAHSLLRGGEFEQAAAEARSLAAGQSGEARAAALAVQGTADHEIALARLSRGLTDSETRGYLRSADAAMSIVLAENEDMDPLGALARRRDNIRSLLASLEG